MNPASPSDRQTLDRGDSRMGRLTGWLTFCLVLGALAPTAATAQIADDHLSQSFIVITSTHERVEVGGRCTMDMNRLSVGRCRATVVCDGQTLFSATNNLGYGPCNLRNGYLTFEDTTLNGDDAVVLTHEVVDADLHLALHVWGESYDITAGVTVPFDPDAPSDPTREELRAQARARAQQAATMRAAGGRGGLVTALSAGGAGIGRVGIGSAGRSPAGVAPRTQQGTTRGDRRAPARHRGECAGWYPARPTLAFRAAQPGHVVQVAAYGSSLPVMIRVGNRRVCGVGSRATLVQVPNPGRGRVEVYVGSPASGRTMSYRLQVAEVLPPVTVNITAPTRVSGNVHPAVGSYFSRRARVALQTCAARQLARSTRRSRGQASWRITMDTSGVQVSSRGRDRLSRCVVAALEQIANQVSRPGLTATFEQSLTFQRR